MQWWFLNSWFWSKPIALVNDSDIQYTNPKHIGNCISQKHNYIFLFFQIYKKLYALQDTSVHKEYNNECFIAGYCQELKNPDISAICICLFRPVPGYLIYCTKKMIQHYTFVVVTLGLWLWIRYIWKEVKLLVIEVVLWNTYSCVCALYTFIEKYVIIFAPLFTALLIHLMHHVCLFCYIKF